MLKQSEKKDEKGGRKKSKILHGKKFSRNFSGQRIFFRKFFKNLSIDYRNFCRPLETFLHPATTGATAASTFFAPLDLRFAFCDFGTGV